MAATGWQAHSVRGAISGGLKKKLGLVANSGKIEGRGRVYRLEKSACDLANGGSEGLLTAE